MAQERCTAYSSPRIAAAWSIFPPIWYISCTTQKRGSTWCTWIRIAGVRLTKLLQEWSELCTCLLCRYRRSHKNSLGYAREQSELRIPSMKLIGFSTSDLPLLDSDCWRGMHMMMTQIERPPPQPKSLSPFALVWSREYHKRARVQLATSIAVLFYQPQRLRLLTLQGKRSALSSQLSLESGIRLFFQAGTQEEESVVWKAGKQESRNVCFQASRA